MASDDISRSRIRMKAIMRGEGIPTFEFNEDKWLRYEDDISRKVYLRMQSWIEDPNRKSSTHAFTAGLERTIARMVEDAIRAMAKRDAGK